jgi:hypothetical protein
MYILELEYPGNWLDITDGDAHLIQSYFRALESSFYEANTALNLFEQIHFASRASLSQEEALEQFRAERKARIDIERRLDEESEASGGIQYIDGPGQISISVNRFRAAIIRKREKWAEGEPIEFLRKNQLNISAKAYIYALDTFYKIFSKLAEHHPEYFADQFEELKLAFPDLIGVRNSLHHSEDRAVGQVYGKKIAVAPLNEGWIRSDGDVGAMIGLAIIDDEIGCTTGDGRYGKVRINLEKMQILQSILQRSINRFKWTGFPTHSPD